MNIPLQGQLWPSLTWHQRANYWSMFEKLWSLFSYDLSICMYVCMYVTSTFWNDISAYIGMTFDKLDHFVIQFQGCQFFMRNFRIANFSAKFQGCQIFNCEILDLIIFSEPNFRVANFSLQILGLPIFSAKFQGWPIFKC